VKAFGESNRGDDRWLEMRQVEEGRGQPTFYVYAVENMRRDSELFTLKVLGGERLARLRERAKEQQQYLAVPWPVADYHACPTAVD
jgi:hypothetical protein